MQPRSWTLLLLVVSNLLLWEMVVSQNLCDPLKGDCQQSMESLFDLAQRVAEHLNIISTEAYNEFNKQYKSQDWNFRNMLPGVCHTSSLLTPNTKTQVQKSQTEVLLKLVVSILSAWKEPLKHVVAELRRQPGVPSAFLSKVRNIQQKQAVLLEGIQIILDKVQPGSKQEESVPFWSGLAYLKSADKDTRISAFRSEFLCLHIDSHKVATYIKVLKCRMFPTKC